MKISIIGAGSVGGQLAFSLAMKSYPDIVLVDVADGLAEGKALDIMQSSSIYGFEGRVTGGTDYSLISNSDIVVVTAGKARQPGMSREDLLKINASIIGDVSEKIKKYVPDCIIIAVTNPLDMMVRLMHEITGFDYKRVIGMAGVLDTARYKHFISQKTKASVNDIEAMILGPHGNTMIVTDLTRVSGKPLNEMLSESEIIELKERARNGGKEVVELLKSGSAFYAPSASVTDMIEAIVKDSRKLFPCSVYSNGSYGLGNIFIGLPVKLGKNGIEEIVEVDLSDEDGSNLIKAGNDIELKYRSMRK